MDARVKELLNRVRENAVVFGKAAGKTVNKVASQAKLNVQLFNLNTEVDIACKEIGRLVYAIHAGEDVCSEAVQAQLETIDSKKTEIAAVREALQKMKNQKTEKAEEEPEDAIEVEFTAAEAADAPAAEAPAADCCCEASEEPAEEKPVE